MEPREDSWESIGWEAEAQQLERDEVLRLARHLAEHRERQRAEDLAEIEELKRTLRERAAQVAVREADVERRRLEIEERDAAIRRQLKKIAHSSALGFANEPSALVAEKLVKLANLSARFATRCSRSVAWRCSPVPRSSDSSAAS